MYEKSVLKILRNWYLNSSGPGPGPGFGINLVVVLLKFTCTRVCTYYAKFIRAPVSGIRIIPRFYKKYYQYLRYDTKFSTKCYANQKLHAHVLSSAILTFLDSSASKYGCTSRC